AWGGRQLWSEVQVRGREATGCSPESVLALDDAGHYKVGVAGSAKHCHLVTELQQLSGGGADATQQDRDLIAVGRPHQHHRVPSQRLDTAVDTLGPHRGSIRWHRLKVGPTAHLYRELCRMRPLEADQRHRSPSFQGWDAGDRAEVDVVNSPFLALEYRDGHIRAERRRVEERTRDKSKVVGCCYGRRPQENLSGDENEKGN